MLSGVVPQEIREAYERSQRRFPTISLPIEAFQARAAKSGLPFGQLHHEDLFLATACALGDGIAWEYFADDYLPLLRRLAARACRQFQESEDLAQEIVATLVEERGRLGGYDGRGSLVSWLRVAVARTAIDRHRRIRREVSLEQVSEHGRDPRAGRSEHGSVHEPLDARWGPILARTLATEIERLPARERLVLSLYYLEDLPLKTIGCRFRVHEATVSRWLDRIRNSLRKSTETELRRRHGLRPGETDSLWRWVSEEGLFSLKESLSNDE
jgi:RNA polymerase sigma-70 factor